MPPIPPDYRIVEAFLRGDLNLEEVTALRRIKHAERSLIALATVLVKPEAFLCKPHKDMVLDGTLKDFYYDFFGAKDDAIVQAAQQHGFHSRSRSRITLIIPEDLRQLVQQHKDSATLAEAVSTARQKRTERQYKRTLEREQLEEQARKILDGAAFLSSTFSTGELVHVIRLLRQNLGDGVDPYTDPHNPRTYSHIDLDRAVEQEAQRRRAMP